MAQTASATAIGARFKPREPIGCDVKQHRVDRAKKKSCRANFEVRRRSIAVWISLTG